MHFIVPFMLQLAGLAACGPVRRNVCDGVNAKPNLYQEYYAADCPPVNTLYSDGTCSGWKTTDNDCTSFCQNTTTFVYGQESPFPRSDCHYPVECSISESSSTSYSYGVSISPKIGKALKVGVSGGYNYGTTTAYGRSWSFTPNEGECGYFTWVPIQKNVCGTLTVDNVITLDPTDPNPIYICDPTPTTNSSCYQEAWTLGGQPDGVVVFVYTDCVTRAPLGPDKQDPTYNQPGVALPSSTIIQTQESWATDTCSIMVREGGPNDPPGNFVDFEINGYEMDWDTIGDQGYGLQSALATCGNGSLLTSSAATPWAFTWTPDDPTFAFNAVGTLWGPVSGDDSTPNCVGDVVVKMGGPYKDRCQGWS